MLRRRVGEARPVISYRNSGSFLYCEQGVFQIPINYDFNLFDTRIWTIIDCSESPNGLPVGIHGDGAVFPIYATSPKPERWKILKQTWTVKVAIMNPWSRAEIKET